MNRTLSKIDKLAVIFISSLIFGIVSSFINLGLVSVLFSVLMPVIFILNVVLAIFGILKKKYFYSIGVLLFFIFFHFFFKFYKTEDLGTAHHISLLTYNVGAFLQSDFKDSNGSATAEFVKFIDSINPDILVFQESPNEDWKKIEGYPYIFLGYREGIKKSLQTIYSKFPIVNKGYIDFPDTQNNAMFADIKIKLDTIRIYNSHLQSFIINRRILARNFDDYDYLKHLNETPEKQIIQATMIKNHAISSHKSVIICGDFNATQFGKTYRTLKRGLNDSFIKKGKGFGTTYSVLKYPLRLDYFLSDDSIEVIEHKNFSLNLSDHEPVLVKFKIK